jgi:hypothetical protein
MGISFNSIMNPTNVALAMTGPTGWAAIAAKTLMSSVGNQLIQNLGQDLGLPQSVISMAQGAFSAYMGDEQGAAQDVTSAAQNFAQTMGASPVDQGNFSSDINKALGNASASIAGGEEMKEARAGGKGGSWLMALAEALGQKLDKMADDMNSMASQISDDKPSLTTLFSAKSQEFGILMNAATTAIKTIGDGLSAAARKD